MAEPPTSPPVAVRRAAAEAAAADDTPPPRKPLRPRPREGRFFELGVLAVAGVVVVPLAMVLAAAAGVALAGVVNVLSLEAVGIAPATFVRLAAEKELGAEADDGGRFERG